VANRRAEREQEAAIEIPVPSPLSRERRRREAIICWLEILIKMPPLWGRCNLLRERIQRRRSSEASASSARTF
jgi:hypothetical protein